MNAELRSLSAMPPMSAVGPAAEPSALDLFLKPLAELLDDAEATDICINRPGEAYVERQDGWSCTAMPFATFEWCLAFAKLVAHFAKQRISAAEPLLSATLPGGQRIQIALPPAAEDGTVSITIRRPSQVLWTLDELDAMGVFAPARLPRPEVSADAAAIERELLGLLAERNVLGFLRRAVHQRRNILLSGATGSGKTTVAKALILEIPSDERIVTIEDVRELSLANQPNHVRLFYSQGGQGQAAVSAGDLLAGAKRQRPDRVFVSELRTGDEVYDYLVSINSGHPGSITSVHADSAELALVALAQLMKRSPAGQGMSTRDGVELAKLSIDVVVQCSRVRQRRFVSEVWYDPDARRRGLV